jgi:hypothetical protein
VSISDADANVQRQDRQDALRHRALFYRDSSPAEREAASLRIEARLLREQLDQLRADLRHLRQDAIDAALAAVEARLAEELPEAVQFLFNQERRRRDGTPA